MSNIVIKQFKKLKIHHFFIGLLLCLIRSLNVEIYIALQTNYKMEKEMSTSKLQIKYYV